MISLLSEWQDNMKSSVIKVNYICQLPLICQNRAITSTIKWNLKNHPDIDIFVSNAGYGDFQPIENFSTKQIQNFLNVNLISHITLCLFMVSHMKYKKMELFLLLAPNQAYQRKKVLYSAAKFGLRGFCQALRDEVATSGIRVCLLNPGLLEHHFWELKFWTKETENNAIEPEDIAKIIMIYCIPELEQILTK